MMSEKLGKYMTAILIPGNGRGDSRTTYQWEIVDRSGGSLGVVQWYTQWRQYCFEPQGNTIFSMGCMLDLADFVRRVNKEHKMRPALSKS